MKKVEITIEAVIPKGKDVEKELDKKLSEIINDLDGEVIDIKEYKEINE